MATYKEIFGKQIKFLSSDPANEGEGQIWYNSTTGTFKSVVTTEAWRSAPAMITPRGVTGAGGGTGTSAIVSGTTGANPPGGLLAESYNGLGWSNETALPTSLGYATGTGSDSEEYVQLGGGYPSRTGTALDYDGSSWTSATAIPGGSPGYIEGGACGPAATALFAGGNNGETTTWERAGGSWTAGGANPQGVYAQTMVGTPTAALSMGGLTYPGGYRDYNSSYNGTGWTTETVLPATRGYAGGAGIQTASIIFGGKSPGPAAVATCVKWDGTSWTATPNLGTARQSMASIGKTVGTAVAIPGIVAPAATEEFNQSANVITAGAWASGGAMGTARYQIGGCGTQTAGLAWGGYSGPVYPFSGTEEYNGASWTAGGAITTGRWQLSTGIGTQTAAVSAGGNSPAGNYGNLCEEYNGASWTVQNTLNTSRSYTAGFGVETAGVIAGGSTSPVTNVTEEYNGASWATVPGTLVSARYGSAAGIESAGLFVAGWPASTLTEEYNGTIWTAGGAYPTGTQAIFSMGTQIDALAAGGKTSPTAASNTSNGYDGTAWSTRPSLATARGSGASAGTAAAALIGGGWDSAPALGTTATEEFNGPTSAANYKTITTS